MLKKVVFTVLIIVGVLFTVGYFRYNPTVNIANTIPAYADVVVRVNLRKIEYKILKDVVKHPFLYFSSSKKTTKTNISKSKISLLDAIDIPTDVFCYTNHNNLKNIWISSVIKIDDKQKLLAFLEQEKFIKKQYSSSVTLFTRNNFSCIVQNNELKLLYSFNKEKDITHILDFILKKNSYLLEKNKVIDYLKNTGNLIAIATKKDGFIELGITKNKLFFLGNLNNDIGFFLPYKAQRNIKSLAHISAKINKELLFSFVKNEQKNKVKKLTTLSLDSIKKHWNGEVDAVITSFINQKDTIVTYEYDDDFNKVVKTTIQATIKPDLKVKFGGSNFFNYLYNKQAIKYVANDSLLVVNPLFKTYVKNRPNELVLYSNKEKSAHFMSDNQHKFSFSFDVENYLKSSKNTSITFNKYLQSVKKMEAFVTDKNKITISICFENSPQSYFYQLLKQANTIQKQ